MNQSEKDPCFTLVEKLAQEQVPTGAAAETLERFIEQAREILRGYRGYGLRPAGGF